MIFVTTVTLVVKRKCTTGEQRTYTHKSSRVVSSEMQWIILQWLFSWFHIWKIDPVVLPFVSGLPSHTQEQSRECFSTCTASQQPRKHEKRTVRVYSISMHVAIISQNDPFWALKPCWLSFLSSSFSYTMCAVAKWAVHELQQEQQAGTWLIKLQNLL